MKILLVLPAASHLRVTADHPQVPKRAMLRFSLLPLMTVAALTPAEHEVSLCDENIEPLDFDADVDLVGVSFMTALAPRAYEIAREFRRRGKLVVAGGYHPTFLPEEAAGHFDAVVVGDAEELWPQLVANAASKCLQRIYRHETLPDLARPPLPRRLVEKKSRHYVTVDAVQTGRGCPHSCRYCSVTAFHQGTYRRRSVESVLADLREIGRDFIFVDDNIAGDPEYARELFKAMIPLGKRWVSQASITIADDPELLRLARAAGCQGLFIGIETINPENLNAVGKGFNEAESYQQRIRTIRRQGIGVIAGIIVGMDKDDVGVFERTLRFLQGSGIEALQLNILTPLPGTPLFTEMSQQQRVFDLDWSHYDYRHVVFQPTQMTTRELQDGADWLYSQFYRLDRILLRTFRTAMTVGPVQAYLALRLNLTYRYDNKRESILGRNPALNKPQPLGVTRQTISVMIGK